MCALSRGGGREGPGWGGTSAGGALPRWEGASPGLFVGLAPGITGLAAPPAGVGDTTGRAPLFEGDVDMTGDGLKPPWLEGANSTPRRVLRPPWPMHLARCAANLAAPTCGASCQARARHRWALGVRVSA